MTYKALILDFDGTAIVLDQYATPTEKVKATVRKAKEKIKVTGATGRILVTANWVIKPLDITEPVVISGGTQIYDPLSQKIVWEITMSEEVVREIYARIKNLPYAVHAGSQFTTYPPQTVRRIQEEHVIYIEEVPNNTVETIIKDLERVPNIAIHMAVGYTPDTTDLHITNIYASKKHAIEVLKNMLGVKTEEIIGIGDSYNDLALFESVGLRVAMGNAVPELKAMADYIAPSVEEDGVADVIEKFVLEPRFPA